MAGGLDNLVQRLRLTLAAGAAGGLSDAQLLERFVCEADQAAFEVLVWRHGPMVLGLCRRILRHEQDAEDAFQAVFLVLARKARAVVNRQALAGWLYRVAYRIAVEARQAATRRERAERGLRKVGTDEAGSSGTADLAPALAEEVDRLPEKYRTAIVLCYLQGKTYEEAAQAIGCPKGTLSIRLRRARQRLQSRLARRGLAPDGLAAGTALTCSTTEAALPAPLAQSAVAAAVALARGGGTAGLVSATALSLSQGAIRAMKVSQIKIAALVVLTVGVMGSGAGVALRGLADEPAKSAPSVRADRPAEPTQAKPASLDKGYLEVPSPHAGVLSLVGTEVKPGESVFAEAELRVAGDNQKYRRLKNLEVVHEGQLLARLDDRLARNDLEIKKQRLNAAEADLAAADASRLEALMRMTRLQELKKLKSVSNEEVQASQFAYQRFNADVQSKQNALKIARLELDRAQLVLSSYEVRSPVRGTVRRITKRIGEAVQQFETLFYVEPAERDR